MVKLGVEPLSTIDPPALTDSAYVVVRIRTPELTPEPVIPALMETVPAELEPRVRFLDVAQVTEELTVTLSAPKTTSPFTRSDWMSEALMFAEVPVFTVRIPPVFEYSVPSVPPPVATTVIVVAEEFVVADAEALTTPCQLVPVASTRT
jgi:hypothetical protein